VKQILYYNADIYYYTKIAKISKQSTVRFLNTVKHIHT